MKVVIENLNSRTTADHLAKLFKPFGRPFSIRVMKADQEGRSACYGIVLLDKLAGLMAINMLNDLLFMEHYLNVHEVSI